MAAYHRPGAAECPKGATLKTAKTVVEIAEAVHARKLSAVQAVEDSLRA